MLLTPKSKDNINFARFIEAGYILPGKYQLNFLVLNGHKGIGSSTYTVNVLERENKSQDENKKTVISSLFNR